MLVQTISKIWKRTINVNTDPVKIITDFFAVFAYFTITSYLGGISYTNTYFSKFGIASSNFSDIALMSTVFVKDVILASWKYVLLIVFLIIVFGLFFFLARYVFRPWLGYCIFIFIFTLSILFSISLSQNQAMTKAQNDWKDSSTLPEIKIYFLEPKKKDELDIFSSFRRDAQGGKLRFLTEDNLFVYVLVPVEGDSLGSIYVNVFPKSYISKMELTPIFN